uniref:Transmembrane protein family 132 middle domain-containing protein n=1 Tax=Panagrolaimus sp. PS1159 TaxID=55785 RepID=A0AC35GT94_9BILA
MHIFSVSEGGNIREVTDKSHCISAEPRLLKTSPTCTSVYVDGSEVRGLAGIQIHVQFRTLNTNAMFTVWYPKLPITVWVSDTILNAINTWDIALWKDLPTKRRHLRNAKQFVCERRYQQTEIKVLAAFHIVDEETGERTFLTGDRDLMFDVTQLAFNRIQSVDPSILTIKKINGRLIGVAKKPGLTRLVIKTIAPAIDYGSVAITVTDDKVLPTQLYVRPISNVHLNLVPQKDVPYQYELITSVQSYFTHPYQHGSLEIYIFYTDG